MQPSADVTVILTSSDILDDWLASKAYVWVPGTREKLKLAIRKAWKFSFEDADLYAMQTYMGTTGGSAFESRDICKRHGYIFNATALKWKLQTPVV